MPVVTAARARLLLLVVVVVVVLLAVACEPPPEARRYETVLVLGDAMRDAVGVGEPPPSSIAVEVWVPDPALCHAEAAGAVAASDAIRSAFASRDWDTACRVAWCESRFRAGAVGRYGGDRSVPGVPEGLGGHGAEARAEPVGPVRQRPHGRAHPRRAGVAGVDVFVNGRYVVVATRARDRWFDLDAVRTVSQRGRNTTSAIGRTDTPRRGRRSTSPALMAAEVYGER